MITSGSSPGMSFWCLHVPAIASLLQLEQHTGKGSSNIVPMAVFGPRSYL